MMKLILNKLQQKITESNYLQKLLINDVNKLQIGDAQYTAMCNNDGGIIDDLILYKEDHSYLLIVNASNLRSGGALQVASTFIEGLRSFSQNQI